MRSKQEYIENLKLFLRRDLGELCCSALFQVLSMFPGDEHIEKKSFNIGDRVWSLTSAPGTRYAFNTFQGFAFFKEIFSQSRIVHAANV